MNYDKLYGSMVSKTAIYLPTSRVGERAYPIGPNDIPDVFDRTQLLHLAQSARNELMSRADNVPADQRSEPRATDVRALLRQQLEAAYDLMIGNNGMSGPLADVEFIEEEVLRPVLEREFDQRTKGPGARRTRAATWEAYHSHSVALSARLPGEVQGRTHGALAWAIAVDASLLNLRLREDMRRIDGRNGFHCPPDLETMIFYTPCPTPEAEAVFRDYVRARWPVLCFGVDPVSDQQNIADAFNRYRDLQLALALSFSAGRINFNQLNRFRRQLAYEASTINLNRTITAFARGDSTFGWRISPRYQTPPEEGSNLHVLANLLIRGGPGPNYQIRKSKLEAGQRELSAVMILPSFLSRVKLEVSGNWYRLHDPDEITLGTHHILKQARRVYELKQALGCVCDADQYPPEAITQLRTKVEELESMLPTQSHIIDIPYENHLGGFELFTPGASSLVPQLIGYQGTEYVTRNGRNSILLFGKNISIQEFAIVAGGQEVTKDDTEVLSREVVRVKLPKGLISTKAYSGKDYTEVHLASPNGISNRLLIPCRPDETMADGQAPKAERASCPDNATPAAAGEESAKPASLLMPLGRTDQRSSPSDPAVKPTRYQSPLNMPAVPPALPRAIATAAPTAAISTSPTTTPISQTVVVTPSPPAIMQAPAEKHGRTSLLDRLLHRQ